MTKHELYNRLTILQDKLGAKAVIVKTKDLPLHHTWLPTIVIDIERLAIWKRIFAGSKEHWADLMIMCNYVWSKL